MLYLHHADPPYAQLTAVHSLQASLDVLRKYRPDYTPRTGFVWPITDPSLSDDASKTRKQDSDAIVPEQDSLTTETDKRSRNTKREQNNRLLINAMRTTAAHSKLSFTPITAEAADNDTAAETPVPTQVRSSATPAPGSQETSIKGPASTVSQPQEPPKGPPGGGKKKKKRMCTIHSCLGDNPDAWFQAPRSQHLLPKLKHQTIFSPLGNAEITNFFRNSCVTLFFERNLPRSSFILKCNSVNQHRIAHSCSKEVPIDVIALQRQSAFLSAILAVSLGFRHLIPMRADWQTQMTLSCFSKLAVLQIPR